ncbi:hypothetical protein ACFL41_02280 [Gemmatimonadota bacterium]
MEYIQGVDHLLGHSDIRIAVQYCAHSTDRVKQEVIDSFREVIQPEVNTHGEMVQAI